MRAALCGGASSPVMSVRTLAHKVGVSAAPPITTSATDDCCCSRLHRTVSGLTLGAADISAAGLSGRDKLIALGLHFIEFADKSPRLFELMYESELSTPRQPPELEKYQKIGHELIRLPCIRMRGASSRSIAIRSVAFWAFVYGFAALRRIYDLHSFDRSGYPGTRLPAPSLPSGNRGPRKVSGRPRHRP